MRGRRRTVAAVLAEALAARSGGRGDDAVVAAALKEACGLRLAREVVFRGITRDRKLLLTAHDEAWAAQVRALEGELCARVNARLGRAEVTGLLVALAPRA